MKRIFILALLLTTIGGTAVAQQSNTWKRYTVKGEEFSVELPALPSMTTSHQIIQSQMKEIWERRVGVYADGVVYTIYSLNDGEPKRALKNWNKSSSSYIGWDLNTGQELTHNGFTGKQYFSSHPLGGALQLFATGNHYYRFQAVGAPPNDPRVQRFFSSLSLGKNDAGIEVTDGVGIPVETSVEASGNEVYSNKDVDRRPVLVQKIEPSYTEEARSKQVAGDVVLEVIFSANGSVTDIKTLSKLPFGMTELAIDATRKIKFIPAVKDKKFVSVRMRFEYHFDLY